MADPQKRYRKMAPTTDRELIDKIDEALAAEGRGRRLWYWPAGPRGRLKASAVIAEMGGFVRPVTLTALADELDRAAATIILVTRRGGPSGFSGNHAENNSA